MQRLSLTLENPFFTCLWQVNVSRASAGTCSGQECYASTLQRLQRKEEKCKVSPQSRSPLVESVTFSLSSDNHSTGTVLADNYEPKLSKNNQ